MMLLLLASIVLVLLLVLVFIVKKRSKKKVPAGIQIFNSAGNIQLDCTDALCRVYGSFSAPAVEGNRTVEISDDEVGRLWAIPIMEPKYYRYNNNDKQYLFQGCSIKCEGKTISWTLNHKNLGKNVHLDYSDTNITFIYGTW